ncbi:hypothetical protein ACJX0J_035098, partial [Zea mays]
LCHFEYLNVNYEHVVIIFYYALEGSFEGIIKGALMQIKLFGKYYFGVLETITSFVFLVAALLVAEEFIKCWIVLTFISLIIVAMLVGFFFYILSMILTTSSYVSY